MCASVSDMEMGGRIVEYVSERRGELRHTCEPDVIGWRDNPESSDAPDMPEQNYRRKPLHEKTEWRFHVV